MRKIMRAALSSCMDPRLTEGHVDFVSATLLPVFYKKKTNHPEKDKVLLHCAERLES